MTLYRYVFKNIGNHKNDDHFHHVYQESEYFYESPEFAKQGFENFQTSVLRSYEENKKEYWFNTPKHFYEYEMVGIVKVELS